MAVATTLQSDGRRPMGAPPAGEVVKHDVFISYRRSDGEAHAFALRDWLLRYRLPRALRTAPRDRRLTVYLDEVYVRASDDFFEREIVPALRASGHLVVVRTPGALAPGEDGGENWVAREIREFRARRNQRRDCVLVALASGSYSDPLPGGLDRELPRVEKLAVHDLPRLRRWWPPAKLRAEGELLPLVAALFAIAPQRAAGVRLRRYSLSRRRRCRSCATRLSIAPSDGWCSCSRLLWPRS